MKFKKVFPLVFIASILIFLSLDITGSKAKQDSDHDSTITISITAVGDLMCHLVEADYAKAGYDNFNFNPYFDDYSPVQKFSLVEKSYFPLIA